jgi:hypothetical protein
MSEKPATTDHRNSLAKGNDTLNNLYRQNEVRELLTEQGLKGSQVDQLYDITPDDFLELGKNREGNEYTYVTVHYVRAVLNFVFAGAWSDTYGEWKLVGNEIIVTGNLTVETPHGRILKHDGIGSCSIDEENTSKVVVRGAYIATAQANCLKHMAAKLGVAWDVACGLTQHPSLRNKTEGKWMSDKGLQIIKEYLSDFAVKLLTDKDYPLQETGGYLAELGKKKTGRNFIPLDENGNLLWKHMEESNSIELINTLRNPTSEKKLRGRVGDYLKSINSPLAETFE